MLRCIDPMTPPSQELSKLYRDHSNLPKGENINEDSEEAEEPSQNEIRAIAEVLKQKLALKAEKIKLL